MKTSPINRNNLPYSGYIFLYFVKNIKKIEVKGILSINKEVPAYY